MSLDLEQIAIALGNQANYEYQSLINPETGEAMFWTADTNIDGSMQVDLDELDLVGINPLPSWVWYRFLASYQDPDLP